MHKDFSVNTRYGQVRLTPTQANHIYVSNDIHGVHHSLVVNNSELSNVSAHYYLWDDGKWHLGPQEKTELERGRQLWAKKDMLNEASDSQKRKLTEEFDKVVSQWAAANSKAIFEAEIADLEQQKERAREAVQEAEENLRVKRDEMNQVYGKLHAALHTPCNETDCTLCFPDTAKAV